jgi:class 3 adenylate cyclase/pimeloyl-ACP methyl ester carboxylesterase
VGDVGGEDEVAETQFAWSGEDRVAFQVFGEGDIDLLFTSASGDAMDLRWYWPPYLDFLRRLGTQARVIMFDRRGMGSSDRASGEPLPGWEQWADDARAVLDAVGSERAVLFGMADGGPIALLFAASHPHRTRGLILVNTTASFIPGDGAPLHFPWQNDTTTIEEFIAQGWGTPALLDFVSPDAARDPAFVGWAGRSMRLAYSPRDASELFAEQTQMDVRSALESVRVPTLVLHREDWGTSELDQGRYLTEHIPGARLVVLPGRDLQLFNEPVEPGLQHLEAFLAELHGPSESDRALAAILFTDMVGSTQQLSAVGDRAWRILLDSHDVVARTVVEQHGGRVVRTTVTTGDGVLATFDGPGRAIRCALALADALRPLGIQIRAGLHTDEVENRENDIAGIAVHIAARVLEAAGANELVVSAAVPMLVAGSGFAFDGHGEHELKGVPGTWHLYGVKP